MSQHTVQKADVKKVGLIATMGSLFQATGHTGMTSRCVDLGVPLSEGIAGTKSTQWPDLLCNSPNGRTRVMVETVAQADMRDLDALKDRMFLLSAYAQQMGWDFHVSCFAGLGMHVRAFCLRNCIKYSKLWEV